MSEILCKARFGRTGVLIAAFLVCWVPESSSDTKSKDIFEAISDTHGPQSHT